MKHSELSIRCKLKHYCRHYRPAFLRRAVKVPSLIPRQTTIRIITVPLPLKRIKQLERSIRGYLEHSAPTIGATLFCRAIKVIGPISCQARQRDCTVTAGERMQHRECSVGR